MNRFITLDQYVVNAGHIVYLTAQESYVLVKMRDGTVLRCYGETVSQIKTRLDDLTS